MMTDVQDYMLVADAIRYLRAQGIMRERRSLINWIKTGKVRGVRLGEGRHGRWLVERASLEEYAKQLKEQADVFPGNGDAS